MLWFFIAGLLIVAVGYLVLPLLRTVDNVVDDRKAQNIRIVREQLSELETSFEQGEMDDEQYHVRRDELEQSLLLDVSDEEGEGSLGPKKTSTTSWVSAGFVALFVPLAAIALYLYLGTPNAVQLAEASKQPEVPLTADGKPDVEKLVASLHGKLRQNPDNAQGWYMLGRSYMMMQRFDGAIEAYQNLYRLQPEEPDVMLMLADALSMKQQGKMVGRPAELIDMALAKAPQNTTALWLSGMALEQQGKYQQALARWTTLHPLLNDNESEQVQLDVLINRAKQKLAGKGPVVSESVTASPVATEPATKADTPANAVQVTLVVSLDESFKAKVSPEDTIFVYAKAQTGPPMPLAAQRIQVKDLPATVVLDDSMAMMPQFKLSSFDTLIVGARVSKTGQAVGQTGDLFIEQEQVSHGDQVKLVISRILKK